MTDAQSFKAQPIARRHSRRPGVWSTGGGKAGVVLLFGVFLIAVLGPMVSPHSIAEPLPGLPGSPPNSDALLGTDYIGRDVLSRCLHGGLTVLLIPLVAILLAYILGAGIGLVAGFSGRVADSVLMRVVDLALSFPPMIVLLVLVASWGTNTWVLVVSVVIVLFPGIARLVRSTTLEVTTMGYVEAAAARGERTFAILVREILPNIAQYVLTDFGLRFTGAILLIAGVNFLGLGVQAPTADWGLMVSENRAVMGTNVWAVLAPAIMLGALTVGVNLVVDARNRVSGRGGRS